MRAPAPARPTPGRVHGLLDFTRLRLTPSVPPLRVTASERRGRRRSRRRLLRAMRDPAAAVRPGGRGRGLRRQREAVLVTREERPPAGGPSPACRTARRGRVPLTAGRRNRWGRSGPVVSSDALAPGLQPRERTRRRVGTSDGPSSLRRGASKTRARGACGEKPQGAGAVGRGRPGNCHGAEDPGREDPPGGRRPHHRCDGSGLRRGASGGRSRGDPCGRLGADAFPRARL